jgi:hypothetical protein
MPCLLEASPKAADYVASHVARITIAGGANALTLRIQDVASETTVPGHRWPSPKSWYVRQVELGRDQTVDEVRSFETTSTHFRGQGRSRPALFRRLSGQCERCSLQARESSQTPYRRSFAIVLSLELL